MKSLRIIIRYEDDLIPIKRESLAQEECLTETSFWEDAHAILDQLENELRANHGGDTQRDIE